MHFNYVLMFENCIIIEHNRVKIKSTLYSINILVSGTQGVKFLEWFMWN